MEKILANEKQIHFMAGLKTGIPIAIGYIPIAITFGLLAKSYDIPNFIAMMMSLTIFAGASQFIGVNLIAASATYWEIVITTFVLNFRHFLMTASLSQRLPDLIPKKWRAILAFGVTDETFSVASTQADQKLHPSFVLGLNLIAFSAWNAGTWVGLFLANGLPVSLQNSMGIALYAMFIGLLMPSLKQSKPIFIVVLLAIGIQSFFYWVVPLSTGWSIIATTIMTALIAAVIFPEKVESA